MDANADRPSAGADETAAPGGGRRVSIVFAVTSVALAIGGFVPVLVDGVANGRLHWSLYALGAVFMAWLIVAPWFLCRRSRATISWGAAVIAVPLYLVLVARLSAGDGWLLPLGLPAAGLGLAFWGLMIWLWGHTRIPRGYAAAITVFSLSVLSYLNHALARPFLEPDPVEAVRILVTACLLGLAMVIGAISLILRAVGR